MQPTLLYSGHNRLGMIFRHSPEPLLTSADPHNPPPTLCPHLISLYPKQSPRMRSHQDVKHMKRGEVSRPRRSWRTASSGDSCICIRGIHFSGQQWDSGGGVFSSPCGTSSSISALLQRGVMVGGFNRQTTRKTRQTGTGSHKQVVSGTDLCDLCRGRHPWCRDGRAVIC